MLPLLEIQKHKMEFILSQKQAVIKLIRKKFEIKHLLKTGGPISLNVNYKVAFKTISFCLKKYFLFNSTSANTLCSKQIH